MARRCGETKLVVNAIAAHHDDVPMESVYAVLVQVADAMSAGRPGARRETFDRYIERLQRPKNLHLVVTPNHAKVVDQFLADLRECADAVRDQPATESGEPALYGAIDSVADDQPINELVLGFIDSLTRVDDAT